MQSTQLNIPSELTTPREREKFFRHLLKDDEQPLEARVGALQALTTLIEQEAYEAGRHAGELRHDGKSAASSDTPIMYRAIRAAWNELQRSGQLLPGKRGTARLLKDEQLLAMFVAIVVRNALETFHADHIPDALMREFNTLVRDAVYTALSAAGDMVHSDRDAAWAASQLIHIPAYWEAPMLLKGYGRSRPVKPGSTAHSLPSDGRTQWTRHATSRLARRFNDQWMAGHALTPDEQQFSLQVFREVYDRARLRHELEPLTKEEDQEAALREIVRQVERDLEVDTRWRPSDPYQPLLSDLRATVWSSNALPQPTEQLAA